MSPFLNRKAMGKSKHETKKHKAKPRSKHLIGTLGDSSLHSSLKDWYAQSGDRMEVQVDGFQIDKELACLQAELEEKKKEIEAQGTTLTNQLGVITAQGDTLDELEKRVLIATELHASAMERITQLQEIIALLEGKIEKISELLN